MRKTKKDRGFSLMELIIAVAILVILLGLIGPQLLKHIGTSRKAACLSDVDTLIREYQVAVAEESPADMAAAKALLKRIMTEHGGTLENDSSIAYAAGIYSGFCKEGGTYNCTISDTDYSILSIECSKHGGDVHDVVVLTEILHNMTFDNMSDCPYLTLDDYFTGSRTTLNSEATGTNALYAPYSSLAEAISAKLTEQGLDVSNRSWRMFKDKTRYNMFLADQKITEADKDTWISCTKYEINTGTVISGTIKVTWNDNNGNGYPILDGGSFKAN